MTDNNTDFTPEQRDQAVQEYLAETSAEAIAASLGKSVRAVTAQLAYAGVYKAKSSTTRVTKAVMVAAISAVVGKDMVSLEKGSHEDLQALYKFLTLNCSPQGKQRSSLGSKNLVLTLN